MLPVWFVLWSPLFRDAVDLFCPWSTETSSMTETETGSDEELVTKVKLSHKVWFGWRRWQDKMVQQRAGSDVQARRLEQDTSGKSQTKHNWTIQNKTSLTGSTLLQELWNWNTWRTNPGQEIPGCYRIKWSFCWSKRFIVTFARLRCLLHVWGAILRWTFRSSDSQLNLTFGRPDVRITVYKKFIFSKMLIKVCISARMIKTISWAGKV